MPRNACRECRRKIKCVIPRAGEKCERCIARSLQCSNSHPSTYQATKPHAMIRSESFDSTRPGYDIGTGSPSDILREGELTKDILKLYFDNFSDVHFLFDEAQFLREFDLGEIHQVILFSMMALGIKYSNAVVFDQSKKSHLGEPFFKEARRMLKENFDHLSLTTIKIYILLSTYHLTFAGARMASNMAKILRGMDAFLRGDPKCVNDCRRTMCTIVLMDRTLSPSLNMPCYFPIDQNFEDPPSEDDHHKMGGRDLVPFDATVTRPPNLKTRIFQLSQIFGRLCIHHRQGNVDGHGLREIESDFITWSGHIHGELLYATTKFDALRKQGDGLFRQFIYIHLLYHHIGQLLYFSSLQAVDDMFQTSSDSRSPTRQCHHHASRISQIVEDVWKLAGIDVHNVSYGQMLTISASVHMHASLTIASMEQKEAHQASIITITKSFSRVREHCRIFDRISVQLNSFLSICNHSSRGIFDNNSQLLRHILHYGTAFERSKHPQIAQIAVFQDNRASFHVQTTNEDNDLPEGHCQKLDWLTSGPPTELSHESLQNYAWLYSESSLNDLYSMPYSDFDTLTSCGNFAWD